MYDLELRRVKDFGKRHRVVLVQMPEGLKHLYPKVAEVLEEVGSTPILSQSPTWGGCDIALNEARAVGASGIVHYGHHGPVRVFSLNIETLFIPARSAHDPLPAVERAIELLRPSKRIVVTASIQHDHQVRRVVDFLEKRGFDAKAAPLSIGCHYPAASISADAFLVIAGGVFHALGLAILTMKKVITADPYTGKAFDIGDLREKILRRHLYMLLKALDAQNFAVIVGVKQGQCYPGVAYSAADVLKKDGRKVFLIAADEVSPPVLNSQPWIHAIVNTACPRLHIDNMDEFKKPIISHREVKYIVRGSIEDYNPKDMILYP